MRAGASQRLDKGLETVADGAQVKGHTPSRIDEDCVFIAVKV